MNSSPHVCCDVDNIIVYGSDARVYVLNSALQVIWVACGGVSKPLSISLFSVGWQRLSTCLLPGTMHYVNKGWHDVGCAKQRVISAALLHLIVD